MCLTGKRLREEESQRNRDATRARLQSQIQLHQKSRDRAYPVPDGAPPEYRFSVPDDKVSWTVTFDEYQPHEYTDPQVLKNSKVSDADLIKR